MKEYTGKTVKIMTCSKCNTKCKHCYINYSGDFDPDELYNIVKNLIISKYKCKFYRKVYIFLFETKK